MKSTLSSLNSILGIDEEAERAAREAQDVKDLGLDRSKPAAAKAEKSYDTSSTSTDAPKPKVESSDLGEEVDQRMTRLMEQAKKLREEEKAGKVLSEDEGKFREEFESLLTVLSPDGGIPKDDLKLLKDKVFGPMNYWVTETRQAEERDGYLIRGNLRGPAEEVYVEVMTKTRELFGGKYEMLVVEDPDQEPASFDEPPRPAFKLVPASSANPPPAASWQIIAGLVLLALSFGSSLQLGLVAEISKLPAETLQWLLNPDNLNKPDAVPPGLEDFDAVSYVAAALPIAVYVLGLQGMHEVGHRLAALVNGTKLGPPLWIPNGQLGTFGSITQIKSLLRDRAELFDVAIGGPVAGGAASLAVFLTGLALSAGADPSTSELLVPVPQQVLASSLGLGSITTLFLGQAAQGSQVLVHPLVVAGWVGLFTNALNLLPVGSLDGGRLVQAAFGKGSLGTTSIITYICLALGLLGGSLALPFGLYIIILNRQPENYIQDSVTEISENKKTVAAALIITALFILLPNAPEITDDLLSGGGPDNFL